MNTWLSLLLLVAVVTGTSAWGLRRRHARDVLAAVGLGEVGVLLGVVLGSVVPGGYMVGSLGGVALAWTRLGMVLTRRQTELKARLAQADSAAEVRLALHDRADSLSIRRGREAPFASVLTPSVAMLAVVFAVAIGITVESAAARILVAGLAFLPACIAAERYIAEREVEQVSRLLNRLNDPPPGQ
jgi:hypothetical protein